MMNDTIVIDARTIDQVPALAPCIVLTSIAADSGHASGTLIKPGLKDVTVPKGATLTVIAELRDSNGAKLPLSDSWRMPLRARDGREKVLLAAMVNGDIVITVPLPDSGCWEIRESVINESLPPDARLRFGEDMRVFVYE